MAGPAWVLVVVGARSFLLAGSSPTSATVQILAPAGSRNFQPVKSVPLKRDSPSLAASDDGAGLSARVLGWRAFAARASVADATVQATTRRIIRFGRD